MNRLLQFTGLLAWIIIIGYGLIYLKEHSTVFNEGLKILGLLTFILGSGYIIVRLIWGDKWLLQSGKAIFVGNDLIKAFNQFLEELPKPTKATTANLAGHLVYRFTRLGIFGVLIALLPLFLLWQQNNLLNLQNAKIDRQNELFDFQNKRVDEQTNLFKEQNKSIVAQTELLNSQNDLTKQQNDKLESQNQLFSAQNEEINDQTSLLETQNKKLDVQINLSESSRRSALIMMMSNIMDKVDEELKNDWNKDGIRNLSPQLIARIVALSKAFRPYRFWQENKLTDKLYSPERGQLLLAIAKVDLDINTYDRIFRGASFENAFLEKADLGGLYMARINLASANLAGTNFEASNLSNAVLINTNLKEANLTFAELKGALLMGAEFSVTGITSANLTHAKVDSKDWILQNDQITTLNVLGPIAELYRVDTTSHKFTDYYQFGLSSGHYKGNYYIITPRDSSRINADDGLNEILRKAYKLNKN